MAYQTHWMKRNTAPTKKIPSSYLVKINWYGEVKEFKVIAHTKNQALSRACFGLAMQLNRAHSGVTTVVKTDCDFSVKRLGLNLT